MPRGYEGDEAGKWEVENVNVVFSDEDGRGSGGVGQSGAAPPCGSAHVPPAGAAPLGVATTGVGEAESPTSSSGSAFAPLGGT